MIKTFKEICKKSKELDSDSDIRSERLALNCKIFVQHGPWYRVYDVFGNFIGIFDTDHSSIDDVNNLLCGEKFSCPNCGKSKMSIFYENGRELFQCNSKDCSCIFSEEEYLSKISR